MVRLQLNNTWRDVGVGSKAGVDTHSSYCAGRAVWHSNTKNVKLETFIYDNQADIERKPLVSQRQCLPALRN